MSEGFKYIGLDFETSGLDDKVHAPIQLGIAHRMRPTFMRYIGGWNWADRPWTEDLPTKGADKWLWQWDNDAAEVHRINRNVLTCAEDARAIDRAAQRWLTENVGSSPAKTIAVGWNIASFDFRFLSKHMPITASSISYRSVDLNALVFGIIESDTIDHYGDLYTYNGLKEEVKTIASQAIYSRLGLSERPHDAGWDALAAIYEFDALKDIINGRHTA